MLRRIIVLLVWFASAGVSVGAERSAFAEFAAAIEPVMASLRTATSYARTGNIALAQMETADAAAAWEQLQKRFGGHAPAPYQAAAVDAFMAAGRERLAAIDRALGNGDTVAAHRDLLVLRRSFHDLRRTSGLYDLGDCVAEIAPAMEALHAAATRFNDEAAPRHAEDLVAAASVFRDRLQRCNDWVTPDISSQPEFRRLIDGAIASAREIARAAVTGDAGLVHRYLIELQSYAQLLDFRFG